MAGSDLLNIIANCLTFIEQDQHTFIQICRIFNIHPERPHEQDSLPLMEQKLKNKILDVFNTEGCNYKDYLKLPKFFMLKPATLQKLQSIFNAVWAQYNQRKQSQKPENKARGLESLIPEFKTMEDVERFHLELLKEFKASRLCIQNKSQQKINPTPPMDQGFEKSSENNAKKVRDPSPFMMGPAGMNMIEPPMGLMGPTMNLMGPAMSMMGPGMRYNPNEISKQVYPKVEEDPKYISNPIWQDDKFIGAHNGFPIPKPFGHELNEYSQRQTHPQPRELDRVGKFQNPPSEIYGEKETNTISFTGAENQLSDKIKQYMFLQCACEGAQRNSSYINCKVCQWPYHLKCLLRNEDQTQELICPCCRLRQGSNIFNKIHPTPFGKRWTYSIKTQKLSFFLTEKQIESMKKEKQSCKPRSKIDYQLRFMKIVRKNGESKKSESDKVRKFNNLPLPADFIEKVRPNNMFQINVKFNDEGDEEESLFFFAIFIVEKYSQLQLTEELFGALNDQNSVGENFISNCKAEKEFIDIGMKDPTSQVSIQYPARGDSCDHPQVFNYPSLLQYYREYGDRFTSLACTFCENKIENVVPDRFLLQQIKKFNQNWPEGQLEKIRYSGEGKVQFNPETQSEVSMDSEDIESPHEESQSLSS